jgi:predicted phosphodiesterase
VRLALVSDLHGNAVGLDAVVRDLEGERFDEILCLGDVAQGGPQPDAVVDRLRELGWPCVLGNADELLLTLDPRNEATGDEREARLLEVARWSRERLGEERLAWFRELPATIERELDGWRFVGCHATPLSNEDVVLPHTPRDEMQPLVDGADVVACGHVHLQWLRRVGDALWFCVGSAGLAYEHVEPLDEQPFEPWAEYAVLALGDGARRLEFRRIPYDLEAHLAAIAASGVPYADEFAAKWRRR